jgi:hypothetical protein
MRERRSVGDDGRQQLGVADDDGRRWMASGGGLEVEVGG